ncbi:alternate-type signal peptide domain-containing protein [Xylanimonas sp. McL0601]|uniref:alternate-type signal peptide domain-containing protein n=1 Tax=Xylanimonas sp. McL0601 TaxID=3414739 RepID=UPI003CEC53C8
MKHEQLARDDERHGRRTGLALRGALSGATATAVLLGGFGAFALWNDSLSAGLDDDIATGRLELVEVTPKSGSGWYFGDGGEAINSDTAINLATFKASPGDEVYFLGTVKAIVEGDDLTATLAVDKTSIVTHDSLSGFVDAEVELVGNPTGELVGNDGAEQTVDVKVTVTFDEGLTVNTSQSLSDAVDLSDLEFTLEQVT